MRKFHFLIIRSFITIVLIGMTTSCQAPEASVAALPTTAATAVFPTPPPLPTPLPTQLLTITPTTLPTTTPTPLQLAVLPEWETAVSQAIAAIAALASGSTSTQPWHITPHEQPAALLQAGQVDAALDWNNDGTLILQDPIALTVPFTTNWETITQAEADEILANGHPIVTIQPWSEMLPTHKALRIDGRSPADADYPLQQRLTLAAGPGVETAVSHLADLLIQTMRPEPIIELAAVGDIMLDRALGQQLQKDTTFPFANVAPLLQKADLTIGNVESALGDIGTPADKSYTFRAPPAAAQSLALAGFDIVSLANNHAMDYGPDTLLQGIDLLQANGITPIGAGANAGAAHAPAIIHQNGLQLAVFSYVNVPVEYLGFDTETWTAAANAPGLAWANPEQMTADITAVSKLNEQITEQQTDLIIVVLHSGYEYVEAPSPPQIAAAHAAIDAGADLVIGHHAHILQGVEFYKDGVIVYGLGNFAFEIDGDPETAVLHAWLDANGVREIAFTPTVIQFGGQPRLATPPEAFTIRQKIYSLSNYLPNR